MKNIQTGQDKQAIGRKHNVNNLKAYEQAEHMNEKRNCFYILLYEIQKRY